jgi:selenide, water dikinase
MTTARADGGATTGPPPRRRGGGCGCKLGRTALVEALSLMPSVTGPDVLVGPGGSDDAAVVRVRDDLAIVASVDVATPLLDDLATSGAVAAVNAIGDLHAMGATPVLALAVAAFPEDGDPRDLARILRAGADAALREGCPVLGGHTIGDPEPTYGLAVIGTVHPDRIMRNDAGRPGDHLVLTKPLGTGVIANGAASGRARPVDVEAAVASMLTSNGPAARAAAEAGVRCATDVTGFGLVGHLTEVAAQSGTGATIRAGAVPLLAGARDLAAAGVRTGGARRNRRYADPLVDAGADVAPEVLDLLHDPQTSGGLLFAVAPGRAGALHDALSRAGVDAWDVGRLTAGPAGRVAVTA